MDEFAKAAVECPTLDRGKIRKRALSLYSTDAVAPQYEAFFERLKTIYPTHFPEG
jgi:hypothetical protein